MVFCPFVSNLLQLDFMEYFLFICLFIYSFFVYFFFIFFVYFLDFSYFFYIETRSVYACVLKRSSGHIPTAL